MAPDVGRTADVLSMAECVGGGDAAERPTGFDDGFLKGRLGRTRFGENVRFMVATDSVINTMYSQTRK